jgi:misacylated tRNA(Ala) deacylase
MTTHFIGYTDAYQKDFKARVVAVNESERAVALDQTAFYPGGGGQPCDFGS